MRETRLYSLFAEVDGKWLRLSPLAVLKSSGVRLFQSALLEGSFRGFRMALRVVKGDDFENKAVYDSNMDKVYGG